MTQNNEAVHKTFVIIIGGCLVGLSSALFLAWHKVPCILVEKHVTPSLHPRAIGYTPRTMEIYSSVGLKDKIPEMPKDRVLRRIQVESLNSEWEEKPMPWTPGKDRNPDAKEGSPFRSAAIAQDRLEPILYERAVALGAEVRRGHRMLDFDQDAESMVVMVSDAEQQQYEIKAQYMIAADGHSSPVRSKLDIEVSGAGYLDTVRSILFHAPTLDHDLERGCQ